MENIDYHQHDPLEKDFQYLFNSGYTMAKFEPEHLEQMLFEIEQNGIHGMEGLIWGKQEFENELNKGPLKEFEEIRNHRKERDRDFDIDK